MSVFVESWENLVERVMRFCRLANTFDHPDRMRNFKRYFLAIIVLSLFGCGQQDNNAYQSVTLSPRQLANLHAFARLYGYARFFYPGTETNQLDWDKFVVYGTAKVIDAVNDKALKDTLSRLFHPIIPTLQLNDNGVIPGLDLAALRPKDSTGYKLSYWQYHGLTNGNRGAAFRYQRSLLVNQYNKIPQRGIIDEYGVISNVPVKAFRGGMLKFSADVKCNPGSGNGENVLFLQPNNVNGVYGTPTRSESEKGDNKLHRREVMLTIPMFADSVLLGTFLRTEGALEIDNCRVQVEKDNKWVDIPLTNGNFERDSIGKGPAAWNNWPDDYQGTSVVASTEFAQGKEVLQINAKNTRQKSHFIGEPLFDLQPAFGTAVQGKLDSGIAFSFPLALYALDGQTYPAADSAVLSAFAGAVKATQLNTAKISTRLADIIILWNVLQHGYIAIGDQVSWEKQLDVFLATAANAKSFDEYTDDMRRILAETKDGFMEMLPSANASPLYVLPVSIGWASGGHLVITSIEKPEDADKLEVGDEILQINNKDALTVFTAKDSLLSYANVSQLLVKRLYTIQLGEFGTGVKLTVQKKNKELYSAVLPYSKMYGSNDKKKSVKEPLKLVRPNILYVSFPEVSDDRIDSLATHLSPDIEYIIWDCRQSFSSLYFLHYIKDIRDTMNWYYQSDIVYPDKDSRNISSLNGYLYDRFKEPALHRLKAKSIFLSEHSEKPYSDGTFIYVKKYDLGTIIGEPTYGFGNPFSNLRLPGGMIIYVNGMFARDDNGKLYVDKGVQPDIEVWPTVQSIREGKDEALNRAIQYAETK